MIRLRFVTVDDSGRKELPGSCLEGLEGVAPGKLVEDRAARDANASKLRGRALDALRIERTEGEPST